jgi:hypothetical protein
MTDFKDLEIPAWVEKAWSGRFDKKDVLFRSVDASEGGEGDWETNAWVRGATDYAYAEGYRRAARLLANDVIQNRWDTDFLVFPIVFLYRHNVELQLKNLIPQGAYLARNALNEANRNTLKSSHRLDQLWGIFEPILRTLKGEFAVTEDQIEAITSYIAQIHAVDELSFSFRYITNKAGTASIDKEKLPYINLGVLAEGMEKLTGFLFGLGEAFREAIQVQHEMEHDALAEYASYMDY